MNGLDKTRWACFGLAWLRLPAQRRAEPRRAFLCTDFHSSRIWARLKLGLIGFVFPVSEGVVYFRNPLLKQSLRSFEHPANWLCFA